MVYESDFYTTRRPYSRPTVTSYTVTWDPYLTPGIGKGQTFHHAIPNVAHRRLTPVSAPAHSAARVVRPSVIIAEIDRINRKMRPSLAYRPTEDYFNDRNIVSFDDETRSIRAQTNDLLKRIHAPLPRISKPLPVIFNTYQHQETALPPRITSDAYIARLLGDVRDVRRDVLTMSQYPEPAKAYIGKGHLACISYAGGRPVARRRKLFHDDDLIKSEVTLLSHYDRMRQAAKSPQVDVNGDVSYSPYTPIYSSVARREQDRPFNSRFYKPKMPERDPAQKRVSEKAVEAVEKATAAERDALATLRAQQKALQAEDDERERKKAEERAAEEREQRQMAARAEAAAAEAEVKEAEAEAARLKAERKAAADRKAHEDKEAQRKAAEEAIRQEEEQRKAEEARIEAEKRAEEERVAAEKKAEEDRVAAEKKAEEDRLAAEKKAEEDRLAAERKAEEDRLAAEKKAEEEKLEAERVAAEKKAEEERIAAEKRAEEERAEAERLEAERKAEEEKKAEEERLAAEEAQKQQEAAAAAEAEAAPEAEAAVDTAPEPEEPAAAEPEPAAPEPAAPASSEEAAPPEPPAEAEPAAVAEEPAVVEVEAESPQPVVEEPTSPDAGADTADGGQAVCGIEEIASGDEEPEEED